MIGFEDSIAGIHALKLSNIDTVFINNSDYYHYNYIIENYNIVKVIIDYNFLI